MKRFISDNKININEYSPLTLAYIGDSVYDLFIRSKIVTTANMPPGKMQKISVNYVSAVAQARAVKTIQKEFTEKEQQVFKRGRNAKSPTVPRNTSLIEYKNATGLECVIGYLYLKEENDRLYEILEMAYAANNEDLKEKEDGKH